MEKSFFTEKEQRYIKSESLACAICLGIFGGLLCGYGIWQAYGLIGGLLVVTLSPLLTFLLMYSIFSLIIRFYKHFAAVCIGSNRPEDIDAVEVYGLM